MNNIGKKLWLIPDMYWPETDHGVYISHEAVCVLNISEYIAQIRILLFFEDRPPIELQPCSCNPMRTKHIRMDQMKDVQGNPLPKGTAYSAMIQSDTPVIAQYTRVDTTQQELALMAVMAYGN